MKNQHYRAQKPSRVPLMVGLAIVLIFVGIAAAALLKKHPQSDYGIGDKAPAQVVANVTQIPASVWAGIGTQGATPGEITKSPAKPTFLYVGALGCPFCAAERWPMTIALSRFGHFSGIRLMKSNGQDSYPDTPTFDYLGATYKSPYLNVHLMEILGRKFSYSRGGFYPTLMKLTPSEAAAFKKFDGPPFVPENYAESFPFVLVGDHYVWIGSSVDPGLLAHKSWLTISSAVRSGKGTLADSILANANALTAAICAVDGRKPENVCRLVGIHVPATVPS